MAGPEAAHPSTQVPPWTLPTAGPVATMGPGWRVAGETLVQSGVDRW